MARKAKKDTRPTIEEVKAQPGKYVIATIEGAVGPFSIKAPRPRTMSDISLESIVIAPYNPIPIDESWLDDGNFIRVYQNHPEIKVYRSDEMPGKIELSELPKEIDNSLIPFVKHKAYEIATSPFGEASLKLIRATNDTLVSERAISDWEYREMVPFLHAVKIYEERFQKRKEVLKEVADRVQKIKERREMVATF